MYKESVWRMALNSLVICLFARNIYTPAVVSEGLGLLGMNNCDEASVNQAARLIHALKIRQKMNFGFRFSDLYLPARLEKAVTTCGHVTREQFDEQVKVYQALAEEDLKLLDSLKN